MPKDQNEIGFKNSVESFSRVRIDPRRVTFSCNITAHNKTEKGTTECHRKCSILLGSVACSFFFFFGTS